MKHQHEYTRRRTDATVETCSCGKFRFTENAGPAITAIDPHLTENGIGPTPGPFPLRMDGGRNPDMFVVVTNQGNHYATTYDPAAARLIVAAPDMLQSLRLVLGDLNRYQDGRDVDFVSLAVEVRAALAKAGGR